MAMVEQHETYQRLIEFVRVHRNWRTTRQICEGVQRAGYQKISAQVMNNWRKRGIPAESCLLLCHAIGADPFAVYYGESEPTGQKATQHLPAGYAAHPVFSEISKLTPDQLDKLAALLAMFNGWADTNARDSAAELDDTADKPSRIRTITQPADETERRQS